jgi:hypothetical protein
MNTQIPQIEISTAIQVDDHLPSTTANEAAIKLTAHLKALRSFFNIKNYPTAEADVADLSGRDWADDLRIASSTVLQCIRLSLSQIQKESGVMEEKTGENGENPESWFIRDDQEASESAARNAAACTLAEVLCGLHEMLAAEHSDSKVGMYTFTSFRGLFERQLCDPSYQILFKDHSRGSIPQYLSSLTDAHRRTAMLDRDRDEALQIIARLATLLQYLKIVEESLIKDSPLKNLLPFFSLINEEARVLLKQVEVTVNRVERENEDLFNVLDGMKFALSMELRKVCSYELVGISSMRQAPSIYARIENAHGLLRDSFQQSIVGLSQLFDPDITGAKLFSAFQTKVQQSIALRSDLWALLQLVLKAEKERDLYPIARLIERLGTFRTSSLRYLMFKDWEACERFIEEVGAARGAIELAPVLNRFSAYLETLLGQVNMRAVLADNPFDYPVPED